MDVRILNKNDISSINLLLSHYSLVTQDIDFNAQLFIGLQTSQGYTAIGGLEFHHPFALVRSVAVHPDYQGMGYAGIICEKLFDLAAGRQIRCLYLLTQTAQGFFSKMGFLTVNRSEVPQIIQSTNQYSSLCPDTAFVMKKQLTP